MWKPEFTARIKNACVKRIPQFWHKKHDTELVDGFPLVMSVVASLRRSGLERIRVIESNRGWYIKAWRM